MMRSLHSMATALAVAVIATLGQSARAQHEHAEHFMKCAKVCNDCQLQCDSCFKHCLTLLADGKKEYTELAQLCADCPECCKTCSTQHAPLAANAQLARPLTVARGDGGHDRNGSDGDTFMNTFQCIPDQLRRGTATAATETHS
jgi:hypothetical protein